MCNANLVTVCTFYKCLYNSSGIGNDSYAHVGFTLIFSNQCLPKNQGEMYIT